jgi:regulator of chromosome condensation
MLTSISILFFHSADGTVWSWGNGVFGQLGHGDMKMYTAPKKIERLPLLGKVSYLTAGCHHNLAITQDQTILAWGWNAWGQLGIGDTRNRATPGFVARFTGRIPLRRVAAGRRHSLALSGKN